MRAAHLHDWQDAVKKGVITKAEGDQIAAAHAGGRKSDRGRRFRAGGAVADLQEAGRRASVLPGARRDEGGKLMARPVFIIDGSRTPFLKARSGPGPFTPVDLAVQCGRPLLARQPFAPDAFDQVILGCVNVIADEMNPGPRRRVAARHGRSDGRLYGADQLRLRHAVDRHGVSLHPRGRLRFDSGRRLGSAELRAAGLAAAGRALVRRAGRRQGHSRASSRRSRRRVRRTSSRSSASSAG